MTRRTKLWFIVATVFTVVNVLGAIQALWRVEPVHTTTHVALASLGAYAMLRLRRGRPFTARTAAPDDKIAELQRSVDAIALEVERIGESQRFISKLASQHAEQAPKKEP